MADTGTVMPPLSQGIAYGIVLGFGIVFALIMNLITWISRKFLHESNVGILSMVPITRSLTKA
jgi:urea-proton symporter